MDLLNARERADVDDAQYEIERRARHIEIGCEYLAQRMARPKASGQLSLIAASPTVDLKAKTE